MNDNVCDDGYGFKAFGWRSLHYNRCTFVAPLFRRFGVTERCQDSKNDFNRVYDVITCLMQHIYAHILRHTYVRTYFGMYGMVVDLFLEVRHFQLVREEFD